MGIFHLKDNLKKYLAWFHQNSAAPLFVCLPFGSKIVEFCKFRTFLKHFPSFRGLIEKQRDSWEHHSCAQWGVSNAYASHYSENYYHHKKILICALCSLCSLEIHKIYNSMKHNSGCRCAQTVNTNKTLNWNELTDCRNVNSWIGRFIFWFYGLAIGFKIAFGICVHENIFQYYMTYNNPTYTVFWVVVPTKHCLWLSWKHYSFVYSQTACVLHFKSKLSNNILHVLRHSKYFHDSEKFNILNYISAKSGSQRVRDFDKPITWSISLNYVCYWKIEFGSVVELWNTRTRKY